MSCFNSVIGKNEATLLQTSCILRSNFGFLSKIVTPCIDYSNIIVHVKKQYMQEYQIL